MLEITEYKVEFVLLTEMLGTTPKNPEIYKQFIENKKPKTENENERETIEALEEKGYVGFHKDDKGLFLYDYMIKGFLKNAGNVVRVSKNIPGLKQKVVNFVNVIPRRIYLDKQNPDGIIEQAITGWTSSGKITALQRCDYVSTGTKFECEIQVIENPTIKKELLCDLLEYGKIQGLLKFRQGGFGKFTYKLL